MIVLSIVLFGLGGLFTKKNKGIDLLALFCFIWAVVFGGAALKLYGMRDYSINTVGIFTIGTFSFVVFAFFGRYGRYKTIRWHNNWMTAPLRKDMGINKIILVIYLIPVTAFVIYSFGRTMVLGAMGIPLGTIHTMYLGRGGEAFFTIPALNQIHSKVIIPCIYCLIPLIVYFTMVEFKRNRIFLIVGLIDIALYTISTGSRVVVIFLVLDILLVLPFSKIVLSNKLFRRIKKIGIALVAFLGVGLIFYTILRKGFDSESDTSVFSQVFGEIYKYFSLCVPLADYWFEQVDTQGIITYGKMTFYGILSFVEWVCAQFFGTGTFSSLDICRQVASNLEVMQPIFSDANCNAFVTYAFYFYIDFGLIGVTVLSSIWGFICGMASKSIKIKQNTANILFYLLLAQTVSMSFSRWAFFGAPYFLAFIYMRLLFIKGKQCD